MKLRFAPSPTGYLHVGNARPALANFLYARRHGGEFLLRLDDTDLERSRPEYAVAIEQDLKWLGVEWSALVRQSDRLALYEQAAEKLKAGGCLYPCFESEEELKAKREAKQRRGQVPIYDRAMLKLTPEQRAQAEANGKRPYWRFLLSPRTIEWEDMVQGTRRVKLPTISDPVLIREDGSPLYTFTSVVDDLLMGITHVIRGEDHVTNTGVQIDIFEALSGAPVSVKFGHLPLLMDAEGGKLSKRIGGSSLRSLRQDGVEAEAVASYLARLGTSEDPEPMDLERLAAGFDLSHFSKSAARFDGRQLLALNRRILHGLSYEQVRDRLPSGADEAFWNAVRGNLDLLTEARAWWEVVAGEIVVPAQPEEAEFLTLARTLLPVEPWDVGTWGHWTEAVKIATGRKGRGLYHPLRLALTGEEQGPELRLLLPLMGMERVSYRLHG